MVLEAAEKTASALVVDLTALPKAEKNRKSFVRKLNRELENCYSFYVIVVILLMLSLLLILSLI